MKNKRKTFDCVEMKRLGSLRIYEKIKDMTFEQKVAYWRERSRQFREEHRRLVGESEPATGPRHSISEAFGRAKNLRTAEDLDAQLAEERAAWDDEGDSD